MIFLSVNFGRVESASIRVIIRIAAQRDQVRLGFHVLCGIAKAHGFGEWTWRYTIPGHGVARWNEITAILKSNGYNGVISVELEDEHFNGTEAGEKAALVHSLNFLKGV